VVELISQKKRNKKIYEETRWMKKILITGIVFALIFAVAGARAENTA